MRYKTKNERMAIFVLIDQQIKNEGRDHRRPSVKVLPRHIINLLRLMNKKLSEVKIIIVVILIINSINAGLVILQNLL